MNPDFTLTQAAAYCGLAVQTFKYHIGAGHLRADYQIGRNSMFSKATLDKFKDNKKSAGRPRHTGDEKMKCDSCGRTKEVKPVKHGQMGKINLCAICREDKRSKTYQEFLRKKTLGVIAR